MALPFHVNITLLLQRSLFWKRDDFHAKGLLGTFLYGFADGWFHAGCQPRQTLSRSSPRLPLIPITAPRSCTHTAHQTTRGDSVFENPAQSEVDRATCSVLVFGRTGYPPVNQLSDEFGAIQKVLWMARGSQRRGQEGKGYVGRQHNCS